MIQEATGKTLDNKIKKGVCAIMHCSKKVGLRGSGKPRRYCYACVRKILKERNPYTYWYDIFRSNARRRKIGFYVTKDEFVRFCKENNYLELKGRGAGKATIDRPRPWEGYTYDNMQIMEHHSNSRKVWIDKRLKHLYDTGQEITESMMDEFRSELSSFEKEVSLVNPYLRDVSF